MQMHNNQTINEELLKYFIEYLETNTDKASGTITNIHRDIRAFIDYLAVNDDASIQTKFITSYIHELEEKYMESSFVTKLSSLRQFINWLNLEENPFWKLKFSLNFSEFSYYSETEIFDRFSSAFSYEQLIIRAIYELYLSQDELIALNLENYNLASNSFNYRGTRLSISSELAELMRYYLKEYRPSMLQQSQSLTMLDPLFIELDAADPRITELAIHKILQSHGLRHVQVKRSRIMNLLDQGLSLEEIEAKLAIKLSNFYKPFVKEQDYRLAKAYSQFHPRAQL